MKSCFSAALLALIVGLLPASCASPDYQEVRFSGEPYYYYGGSYYRRYWYGYRPCPKPPGKPEHPIERPDRPGMPERPDRPNKPDRPVRPPTVDRPSTLPATRPAIRPTMPAMGPATRPAVRPGLAR